MNAMIDHGVSSCLSHAALVQGSLVQIWDLAPPAFTTTWAHNTHINVGPNEFQLKPPTKAAAPT